MTDESLKIEKAMRLLVEYLSVSNKDSRKPILFHDIRVGVYLYENGYDEDIVLAGFLHDMLEWSEIGEQLLRQEFGDNVTRLILANTKNRSIENSENRINESVKRCVDNSEKALIVKSADIMDSFKWYTQQKNNDELEYCKKNAKAILKYRPGNFNDKIFEKLKMWAD